MNNNLEAKLFWRFSFIVNAKNEALFNWGYTTSRIPKQINLDNRQLDEFFIELINRNARSKQILLRRKVQKLLPGGYSRLDEFRIGGSVPLLPCTTDIVIYRKNKKIFTLNVPQDKPNINLTTKLINAKGTQKVKTPRPKGRSFFTVA